MKPVDFRAAAIWRTVPALLALLLASCSSLPPAADSPASGAPPVSTTAEPSPAAATTVTSPMATPGASSATPVPSSPPLDVSDAEWVDFVSPSGRIRCSLSRNDARCDFPAGMNQQGVPAKAPNDGAACLNMGIYTGVGVQRKASFQCWEEPVQPDVRSAKWWRKTGWPSVRADFGDRQRMPVLPYGKSIQAGDLVCTSSKKGMTCQNQATGNGFRVALQGVTFLD